MIQYQQDPWQSHGPVPLPKKNLADPGVLPREADQAATQATTPTDQPSTPPLVFADDEYQWMLLL